LPSTETAIPAPVGIAQDTPLRAAIHGNHLELVRYLVHAHHVDVHEGRPDSGSLPHNYAASRGSVPIVKFLVETVRSMRHWPTGGQQRDE
jgi:ankyrin repeat protein